MATTYKIFLDKRRDKKNNCYPLKVRITHDRRSKEVSLNLQLPNEAWDETRHRIKPSHPNEKLITLKINKTLKELQESSLKLETGGNLVTLDGIAKAIIKKPTEIVTFFSYADHQVAAMENSGRIGNALAYKHAIAKLLSYTNNKMLRFECIDYRLLENFTSTMLSQGTKINTIAIYMREIRAIYNKAIKEGIVEQKYYPFSTYKIKNAKTISRALTVDEMKSIIRLEIEPNTTMWHSRNYFLLSYCLIGMNFTDMFLLTPDSIQNDRIMYSRSKTKKVYSINLHTIAKSILHHYYNPENKQDFLLPVLSKNDSPAMVKRKAKQAIKTTNEYMGRIAAKCSINLPVSTYYARYSWANICRGLGYSKDIIAQALGHEIGNRVTGIYLDNYGDEKIDAANKEVIETVFA